MLSRCVRQFSISTSNRSNMSRVSGGGCVKPNCAAPDQVDDPCDKIWGTRSDDLETRCGASLSLLALDRGRCQWEVRVVWATGMYPKLNEP